MKRSADGRFGAGAAWTPAVVAAGLIAAPAASQESEWRCPDPTSIVRGVDGAMAHVRFLADDLLEGREVATRGERCAGDYVAERFRVLGLRPAGDGGGYFQSWTVRVGSRLAAGNRLSVPAARSAAQAPTLGVDWTPYGFSASGRVEAPTTLAPRERPDDPDASAHREVAGRVVVVDARAARPHGPAVDAHRVASRAAAMGAAGAVVALEGAALPRVAEERRSPLPIPVVAVTGTWSEAVVRAAQRGDTVAVTAAVEAVRGEARNVVAVLPGADPGTDRTIVVGAHYDHLGFGGEGSLSPDRREVHNGADDNASGTAVLLETARALATGPPLPLAVVFAAFTGEEKGLWGSAKYVEAPPAPLERTVAMLNLDMVGRVENDALTVFGTGTAEEWPSVLDRANGSVEAPLALAYNRDGFGASDHSSFYAKRIPVLHFFSNTHAQYHRADDDWELINGDGLARVTDLVAAVVRDVARPSGAAPLTPVLDAGGARADRGSPADGATRSGFRVRVGTLPDYSRESGGMGIAGVRDGSPAARAGIRGGDVLIRFGLHEIDDVYGYMYALADHEPGDEVEVVVLRAGERVELVVVLEAPEG